MGLLCLATLFSCVLGDVTVLGEDELISGLSLGGKEFQHYHLTVTGAYRGDAHLSISAFATSYNSDPDIYISKSILATRAEDADYQCQRDGTDTCVIPKGMFDHGDNIYITIFCMRECTFDLKAFYAPEIELVDKRRTSYRWGGHSTAFLKYYIPYLSGEGFTDSFSIKIEPERPFSIVDVFISVDDTFNIIDDKPAQHLLSSGVAVMMNEDDRRWCVECYIYLVVVMQDDMRVYVTADALTRTMTIGGGVQESLLMNEGRFTCFAYSVGSINNDVLFGITNFQGNSDIYIARRNEPSTTRSTAIKLSSPIQHPRQILIVTKQDRSDWSAELGAYYICAESFAVVSAESNVSEDEFKGIYPAHKEFMYTFLLHQAGSVQLIYKQDELWSQRARIEVEATVWASQRGDLSKIKVFYTVCNDWPGDDGISCDGINDWNANSFDVNRIEQLQMTEEQNFHGDMSRTTTVTTTNSRGVQVTQEYTDVVINLKFKGAITHEPSVCEGHHDCKYIFFVYNPSPSSEIRKATFIVTDIITEGSQDVVPGEAYRNTIQMGQYIYYRLLDAHFDLEYISQLKFDLISYAGDADLFISTRQEIRRPTQELGNFDFQSRRMEHHDQIKLNDTVNNFMTDYIYIGVYGNVRSDYELIITPVYHPHFNERLMYATPLVERTPVHVYFASEWDSAFFSFKPYWSMHEDRTVVFLAESFQNDVTFYFTVDDYPLIYKTDFRSRNEMYSIHPEVPGYTIAEGHWGNYYIRVRPGYILSDLIVNDPYEFDFHAFSQPAGNGLTDLYANDPKIGVAWGGQNTYYRHFLTDIEHTVMITLTRMPRKGFPKLMVKFKDEIMLPESNSPSTFDQKLETGEYDGGSVQMWLHKEIRSREMQNCDFAGYPKQGGLEFCGIYIAVECAEGEFMCAYKIELSLLDYTDFTIIDDIWNQTRVPVQTPPPRYIPNDQDYVDGSVFYRQEMQLYYPIIPDEFGDGLILVNKTGPIHENGDLSLQINVQADATKPYSQWTLPTYNRNTARSRTFDPVQPEIIDASQEKLQQACRICPPEDPECRLGEYSNDNCAILINIRGETEDYDSHFRVKVFNGTNRLYPNKAIEGTLQLAETFDYYWFISTAAMAATDARPNWLHEIGLGIKTPGMDIDMYVSVMDGRLPTAEDYDYKSENFGSDWITISNNDTMWEEQLRNENMHSWNPRVGMVVVVGVKAKSNGASHYSLVLKGPNPSYYPMTTLVSGIYTEEEVPANPNRSKDNPYVQVFKWYNWQHMDFEMSTKLTFGAADFYLNKIGETNFEENAISGLPLSPENSQWFTELNMSESNWQDGIDRVLKIDTENYNDVQFCYNCWYYLTVRVEDPRFTKYRVTFFQLPDEGTNYLSLDVGFSTQLEIEEQGERKYVRFLLDSKDPIQIEVEVSIGVVLVQVSSDPQTVDHSPIWSMQQDAGNGKIVISKDDPSFHMATWFYISVQSLQGSSISSVRVNQDRIVSVLANGYPHKFQFISANEIVKFMVFEVPSHWSQHFVTTIEVEPLSDHVYPSLYLKKIELQDEPDDFQDFDFPTIQDYDHVFGDNFSYQLYNHEASYSFSGTMGEPRTYYAMTVYSNVYGMSDVRKPDFKLTVTSTEIVAPGRLLEPNGSGEMIELLQ